MTVCLIVCLQTQNKEVRIIPRVWGQGRHQNGIGRTAGIIRTLVRVRKKNHPHACGDKPVAQEYSDLSQGSSPRVWGQAVSQRRSEASRGIIPTRVGTSSKHTHLGLPVEDHPHACGDKLVSDIASSRMVGSSPCVWGQEFSAFFCSSSCLIIPMRVGTRDFEIIENRYGGDHPHACGDKPFVISPSFPT